MKHLIEFIKGLPTVVASWLCILGLALILGALSKTVVRVFMLGWRLW